MGAECCQYLDAFQNLLYYIYYTYFEIFLFLWGFWWWWLTWKSQFQKIRMLNKLNFEKTRRDAQILESLFSSMHSGLGWASSPWPYCLRAAKRGPPVALLRCNRSPGRFDSSRQVICLVGSLPLDDDLQILWASGQVSWECIKKDILFSWHLCFIFPFFNVITYISDFCQESVSRNHHIKKKKSQNSSVCEK